MERQKLIEQIDEIYMFNEVNVAHGKIADLIEKMEVKCDEFEKIVEDEFEFYK